MIRCIFLDAFILILSVFYSLLGIVISLFDRTGGKSVHFWVAVPWAKAILWGCGVKVDVSGQENVDPGRPRIYMSSHQSYFDIFALLSHLPVDFKFILKRELMNIPLLGPAMKGAGYIPIDRGDPRKAIKSMNEAAERMRNGASVLIFPEGTRSSDGRLQPFKSGGFHLALKSGCEIVPVGIAGSYRIVPKGSFRVNKGSFTLRIGRPISTVGYSKRQTEHLMGEVRKAMLALMGQEEAAGGGADG